MMTLANYGLGSSKRKDPNSAKVLSKSLQIRNRSELLLKQHLKSYYRINNDKRTEIINSINDYYSRIPFNMVIWNKYQTKQCIIDSILLLDTEFNPYKARDAFKHIEKMLINLVYLPWHKEFRKIYTYSGLYRLSVSEPLIGVEEIFKVAGFEQSRDCPMHLVLPDDKMPQTDDGESVTSVIFDCMVAQVVCSDIIDIFENSCKMSKQPGNMNSEVNCYSWIQAYFRERSQQTTEIACSNIQDLLNNLTNHLSRVDTSTAVKSPGHKNRLANQQNDKHGAGLAPKYSDARELPKLSTQERAREFLVQQSHEDDNLLTLSEDLLRFPSSEDNNRRLNQPTKYSDHDAPLVHRTAGCPSNEESSQSNGYSMRQQHGIRERMPSRQVESHDSTDHQCSGNLYRSSTDSIGHSADVDPKYNDREPLLPRIDRKPAPHQNQPQSKRLSMYDNDFDVGHQSRTNGLGRHHYDQSYFGELPSHPPHPSSNQIKSLASSKYNTSSYRKYESRDSDNKSTGKGLWSCGLCTYNNQVDSEMCEMCHNRRPSR